MELWMFLLVFFADHSFNIVDQIGSFLLHFFSNSDSDLAIRVGDFGNDEVQEDQRGNCDHEAPDAPEEDMLFAVQRSIRVGENSEIEVTQSKSKGCNEVTDEWVDVVVFWCLVLSNDIKDQGEHENQNGEEDQEDHKVLDNVLHHSDDIAEGLHNTHVEELLEKTGDNCEDHNELGKEGNW